MMTVYEANEEFQRRVDELYQLVRKNPYALGGGGDENGSLYDRIKEVISQYDVDCVLDED